MSRAIPLARWVVSSFVLAAMLMLCAGRVNGALTAYLLICGGAGLVTAVLTDTSLDEERREPRREEAYPNSRRGATALFLVTVIVAALDDGRFHWTALSRSTQILALPVLILAAALQVWTMAVNPFFSSAIRIQTDHGHKPVTRGPYRFIRHPGYLAMVIIMPATALALGSLMALIPALGYSGLILWRTKREDEFLVERLAGYAEYSARVRHRLIPDFW
jgi:protein-S-isoprenylcysteine O-methyltransferase Ste14